MFRDVYKVYKKVNHSATECYYIPVDIASVKDLTSDDFDIPEERTLGKGTYGKVISFNNSQIATKISDNPVTLPLASIEYHIGKYISEKICCVPRNYSIGKNTTDNTVYHTMRKAEGDLNFLFEEWIGSRRVDIRDFSSLILSLHAAHLAGVVHGDIKPGNILAFRDSSQRGGYRLQLCDWGNSLITPYSNGVNYTRGTPGFTPIRNYLDIKSTTTWLKNNSLVYADMFALACVIVTVYTGRNPIGFSYNPADYKEEYIEHLVKVLYRDETISLKEQIKRIKKGEIFPVTYKFKFDLKDKNVEAMLYSMLSMDSNITTLQLLRAIGEIPSPIEFKNNPGYNNENSRLYSIFGYDQVYTPTCEPAEIRIISTHSTSVQQFFTASMYLSALKKINPRIEDGHIYAAIIYAGFIVGNISAQTFKKARLNHIMDFIEISPFRAHPFMFFKKISFKTLACLLKVEFELYTKHYKSAYGVAHAISLITKDEIIRYGEPPVVSIKIDRISLSPPLRKYAVNSLDISVQLSLLKAYYSLNIGFRKISNKTLDILAETKILDTMGAHAYLSALITCKTDYLPYKHTEEIANLTALAQYFNDSELYENYMKYRERYSRYFDMEEIDIFGTFVPTPVSLINAYSRGNAYIAEEAVQHLTKHIHKFTNDDMLECMEEIALACIVATSPELIPQLERSSRLKIDANITKKFFES